MLKSYSMICSKNFDCTLTLAIWGLQSRTTFFTEFLSLFSRSSRKFIASTELETYKQEFENEDPYFAYKHLKILVIELDLMISVFTCRTASI